MNADGWSSPDAQVVCRQLGYDASGTHVIHYDSFQTHSIAVILLIYNISGASFYLRQHKSQFSSPIFMDNVACYGSETKLIECSHHTDTIEDDHSEDIWVKCGSKKNLDSAIQNESDVKQSNINSMAALTVALIVCLLVITLVIIYVAVKYLRKKKSSTQRSE